MKIKNLPIIGMILSGALIVYSIIGIITGKPNQVGYLIINSINLIAFYLSFKLFYKTKT